MIEEEKIIKICSYEEFNELCIRAGGDEFTYREIIKAIVQINLIMEEMVWEMKMNN
tara:strand:- start:255 stop:422 length:168 start_codon:yes stop_codon:yes gene_type:complete